MRYAVTLTPTARGYHVDVPDLLVATEGRDVEHARAQALTAVLTVFGFAIRTRQAIPLPVTTGLVWVTVPATVQVKAHLHNAMVAAGVTQAEMARRLGTHRQQVARLLDLDHPSTLGQLTAALAVVGRELLIQPAEVWHPTPMLDVENVDAVRAGPPRAKRAPRRK